MVVVGLEDEGVVRPVAEQLVGVAWRRRHLVVQWERALVVVVVVVVVGMQVGVLAPVSE